MKIIEALKKIIAHARVIREIKKPEIQWTKEEKDLKNLLKTRLSIRRIEAYDVSNIQGKEATGSMVTFWRGEPKKDSPKRLEKTLNTLEKN